MPAPAQPVTWMPASAVFDGTARSYLSNVVVFARQTRLGEARGSHPGHAAPVRAAPRRPRWGTG